MKKIILPLVIAFLSSPVFAGTFTANSTKDKREITPDEQALIKLNVNSAHKILLIEQLCFKEKDKVTYSYASSLIYSSAFIKPNLINMEFAKHLEEKTLKSIVDIQRNGEKCVLQTPEDLNRFRQKINAVVVTSLYNFFSNEKTLKNDVDEYGRKSIFDMLEFRFFNPKIKYNVTPKNSEDTKDKLLNNYINAVAGYRNLTSCYKSLNMTEDGYSQMNKKLGPFLLGIVNSLENYSTLEKLTLLTTGFVLADTLHKNSCENTKIALNLYSKLNVEKIEQN